MARDWHSTPGRADTGQCAGAGAAVERALHEDSERRALQGELAGLDAAWREADEVAHIADSLFDEAPGVLPAPRAEA